MLTIRIITVGRNKEGWTTAQTENYRKLISRYAHVDFIVVPEEKYSRTADIDKLLSREEAAIKGKIKHGYTIALDASGVVYDTAQLAQFLGDLQVQGHSTINFIIGGPYGLSEGVKKKAELLLSLSALTMSHQIVRGVLLEQLYRVLNLNSGGNYHK